MSTMESMARVFPLFQGRVVPPPPRHDEVAGDGYGMNEWDMDETGPIQLDEAVPIAVIGPEPTVEMCIGCECPLDGCHCDSEGA